MNSTYYWLKMAGGICDKELLVHARGKAGKEWPVNGVFVIIFHSTPMDLEMPLIKTARPPPDRLDKLSGILD